MNALISIVWGLIYACLLGQSYGFAPVNSIPVKVVNHAGAPIEVFWIDTNSLEENLVRQTSKPLRNSSDANINSYNGHQFVAKFLDDIPGAEAFFTKGPTEETVLITYDPETNVMNARQVTKFDEIMELINAAAASTCNNLKDEAFAECIGEQVLQEVQRLLDTTKEIKRYRDQMSPRLFEYVCADDQPNVTHSLRSMTFEDRKQRYTVDLLIDTKRAKIWVVPDAVSPEECGQLLTGSVSASGSVGAELVAGSDVATTTVPSDLTGFVPEKTYNLNEGTPYQDPLWPLFTKIYRLTNFVAKHRMPVLPNGQEGFGISHYGVGQGVSPSCSGACEDGSAYQTGDRIASALLFCEVAEEGGMLMFPKSDVVIRPTKGMGVFFSYKRVNSTETDDGYTQHGLCPVRAGQHTVVSLHQRDGVAKVAPPALESQAAPAEEAGGSAADEL